MDKLSYALGLGIGHQLSQMGAENLNIDDFAQAIKDVIAGNEPKVSNTEAQTIVQEFFQKQEEKQRAAAAERPDRPVRLLHQGCPRALSQRAGGDDRARRQHLRLSVPELRLHRRLRVQQAVGLR